MDLTTFEQEIKRLKSQWPNGFGDERKKELWKLLKDVPNFDFRDAVSYLLVTARSCPLAEEIQKAIQRARNNYFEQKRIDEATQRGIFNSIPDAGTCDREFKNKCVELYNSFMDKKITREQFFQGCDLLDQAAKIYGKKQNPQQVKPAQLSRPYSVESDEKPY